MNDATSPFRDPANRLVRPVDDLFRRAMLGPKAIVRLVGPRRIGKTEMVADYIRNTGAPLVDVTIPVVPPDMQPAEVVLPLLQQAIAKLQESEPALKKEYDRLTAQETGVVGKAKVDAEISGGLPGVFQTKATAGQERATGHLGPIPAVAAIGPILSRLERAARKLELRPVLLFDEVQELVVGGKGTPDMSAAWAIRNEVQHHEACRSVFAGSNQRLYQMLSAGNSAPLLHLGTSIEVPLLTTPELDAWAKPLFAAGGRRVESLAPTNELVAGKIGEVVDVFDQLWLRTRRGEEITADQQREAVLAAASGLPVSVNWDAMKALTRSHAVLLRWVMEHPGQSPYAAEALATHQLNPGAVSNSLQALQQADMIESFGEKYVVTLPLRTIAAMQPNRLAAKLRALGPSSGEVPKFLKNRSAAHRPKQSL